MSETREQIEPYIAGPPDGPEFAMWRAVFALAHVDNAVAPEEIGFLMHVLELFKFTPAQFEIIYADLTNRGDAQLLFPAIAGEALRALFFRLARILVWCDGFLHEREMAVIEEIKNGLGPQAARYESDLRWLGRKPELPLDTPPLPPGRDEVVEQILVQMLAFYQQRAKDAA
jgi:hypothetical protein